LKIIGIGTGESGTMTIEAMEALKGAARVVLQTGTVPVAEALRGQGIRFETLDELYAASEDFDRLAQSACGLVLNDPETVFCVMGSVEQNALASAVRSEAGKRDIPVSVTPGLSIGAYAAALSGIAGPVQEFSATDFITMEFSTNHAVVISEVDTENKAADIKLKLLDFYPESFEVYVVQGKTVRTLPVLELDRLRGCSYQTAIAVPPLPLMDKCGYQMDDLVQVMAILRGQDGCPWDREQTHETLRQYLLEESYEVLDAIEQDDMNMLCDELGDVLLQAAFHAQIASEHGDFNMTDVITAICKKMISRHTHIFASDYAKTADDVMHNWEKIKQKEKNLKSYTESLKDIPRSMSALMRAAKIQKKAALAGFDWPDYRGALEKVYEELEELKVEIGRAGEIEAEAGDLLFAAVNLLRLLGLNGEVALSRTSGKFIGRFETMEKMSERDLKDLSLEELDALWEKAKELEQ